MNVQFLPNIDLTLKSEKMKNSRSWKHMNLLDGAMDDLAERIDERLKDITGMQRAEDSTPQEQTVDKLPVIHRLICFL